MAALAILVASLASVLKECGARGALPVSLAGGLALFFFVLLRYAEPLAFLRSLAEQAGLAEGFSAVLRMMAVAWAMPLITRKGSEKFFRSK